MGPHLVQERVVAIGGNAENLDGAWPAEQARHGLFRCQVGSRDHDIRTGGEDAGRIEFGAGQFCHDDKLPARPPQFPAGFDAASPASPAALCGLASQARLLGPVAFILPPLAANANEPLDPKRIHSGQPYGRSQRNSPAARL